jgi:hypothetical protein
VKEKISYDKMAELLADGLELIDRDEDGQAYRLYLIPGYDDQIFAERCPEWDEKNDGHRETKEQSKK